MTTHNRKHRVKLTYSNAVATLALFFAIGGTGAFAATHLGRNSVGTQQLKTGAVTGAKVKDGSIGGVDVDASSLGKVPSAAHADAATNADHAGRADTAARATSAAHADSATTANRADVAAALTELEPIHYADTPGEPESGNVEVISQIGFYRDHEGIVHLQGLIRPKLEAAAGVVTLPPGFRSARDELFYGVSTNGETFLSVEADGEVRIIDGEKGRLVSLAGVTWRAASAP
jgi:hypothetical protein